MAETHTGAKGFAASTCGIQNCDGDTAVACVGAKERLGTQVRGALPSDERGQCSWVTGWKIMIFPGLIVFKARFLVNHWNCQPPEVLKPTTRKSRNVMCSWVTLQVTSPLPPSVSSST